MSFTMESIESPAIPVNRQSGPTEFDLPVREFTGYDPKGKTDITGQSIVRENPKQSDIHEEVEKPVQEESVSLSPRLTALARKDQAQRRKDQELSQREKALEAKLADAEKYSELKSKIASKDYSAAEELGLTYEEFVQHELNKKEVDPSEARQKQLEEKLSRLEKQQEESTIKEYETNQKLWAKSISDEFGDGTKYPNLAYLKSKGMKVEEGILDHINVVFEEDNEELTEVQALEKFEEEAIRRSEMYFDSPAIKSKFGAPAKLGPPKTSPKTITQNMTVTSQKQTAKPFHLMSESEQIAEAIRRVQAAKLKR